MSNPLSIEQCLSDVDNERCLQGAQGMFTQRTRMYPTLEITERQRKDVMAFLSKRILKWIMIIQSGALKISPFRISIFPRL